MGTTIAGLTPTGITKTATISAPAILEMVTGNKEAGPSGDPDTLLSLLQGKDLEILKRHVTAGLKLPSSKDEFDFTYESDEIKACLSRVVKNESVYKVREITPISTEILKKENR